MNISNNKKIILILIIILLAFFGYWFFFLSKKDAQNAINQSNNQTNQNVTAQTPSSNTQYDKDFVSSLIGLNSVNLDVSVLSSKTYKALNYPDKPFVVNYSMDSGRDNPFLPIGSDTAANSNIQSQNKEIDNATSSTVTATTSNIINNNTSTTTTVKPIPKKF